MVSHFVGSEINMRLVLDWAFFARNHTKEIDWNWLDGVLQEYHIKEFTDCINAICIEDLGFAAEAFPAGHCTPSLKERVLADIIRSEPGIKPPKKLIPRIVFRFRRWRANAWKQRLCFNESRISMFLGSIWGHLLKPDSI